MSTVAYKFQAPNGAYWYIRADDQRTIDYWKDKRKLIALSDDEARIAATGAVECRKCGGSMFTEEGDPETSGIKVPCPLCFDATPATAMAAVDGREASDAEELRFYRRYSFPYVDHSTMFDESHQGLCAIKLPMSWPHPEGEGTCAATIVRAFTVEQLYVKARQHIESLGPDPAALTPSPGAAGDEPSEQGGSEHSVDAPIPPLPLGDSASRGGKS